MTINPDDEFQHVHQGDRRIHLPPDADGLYHSRSFPGLWLDPPALLAGDLDGVPAALDRGLANPEHAAFVARLVGGGQDHVGRQVVRRAEKRS